MPLDARAPLSGSHAGDLARHILAMQTDRDKLSLTLDALRIIAPREWLDLLTALRDAREWEHDDEEAAYHFEQVARAAEKAAEDCYYHAEHPGERY